MAASAEEITEEADYDYVGEPVCTVEKITAPPDQRFRFLTQSFPPIAVCWLILLVIMGLRIHFTSVISENNAKLTAENQQLNTQNQELDAQNLELGTRNQKLEARNQELEIQTQELGTQNQELGTQNQGLEGQKNNLTEQIRNVETSGNVSRAQWSIDAYCPRVIEERQCKPCQDGWQHFQVSCYLINNPDLPKWKTWEEAQEHCRGKNSDLVVIDDDAEKNIINGYSWGSSGTDGYWIGLRVEDREWKWVDGSGQSKIFWTVYPYDGHCAMSVQASRWIWGSWRSVSCSNRNRWICKKKALFV
ncbi:C-type lectin domain family 4 member G-like isoform X2 [Sebastes umbrosus]|nr:C-type lectin domain family 4 member G-like isoform X2 [Sebastes umbrosus]